MNGPRLFVREGSMETTSLSAAVAQPAMRAFRVTEFNFMAIIQQLKDSLK
jgi:hypothetical protein